MLLALFAAAALTPAERAAVMAPVEAVFAAIAAHDPQALLAQTWGLGGATVAVEEADGTRAIRQLSWPQLAASLKPGPEVLEETIVGDPIVRVDGDIALVWGRYAFRIDGKVHHCGMDHFQLTRIDQQWKITSLTWSNRKIGCPAK